MEEFDMRQNMLFVAFAMLLVGCAGSGNTPPPKNKVITAYASNESLTLPDGNNPATTSIAIEKIVGDTVYRIGSAHGVHGYWVNATFTPVTIAGKDRIDGAGIGTEYAWFWYQNADGKQFGIARVSLKDGSQKLFNRLQAFICDDTGTNGYATKLDADFFSTVVRIENGRIVDDPIELPDGSWAATDKGELLVTNWSAMGISKNRRMPQQPISNGASDGASHLVDAVGHVTSLAVIGYGLVDGVVYGSKDGRPVFEVGGLVTKLPLPEDKDQGSALSASGDFIVGYAQKNGEFQQLTIVWQKLPNGSFKLFDVGQLANVTMSWVWDVSSVGDVLANYQTPSGDRMDGILTAVYTEAP